ncbi:MAG: glycoside hydrolase family 32 protein [Chthonomonadales bacterium]|nr:glycoside hydrolase family 32 protein [Chthonomonadales bacterium]
MNRLRALAAAALGLLAAGAGQPATETVISDFEGSDYAGWTATGQAFGAAPAPGALPNQMPVAGYLGRGLVNSYRGGDGARGTLTSPPFVLRGRYLSFLVGGGAHPGRTCVSLLVGGAVARTATGRNDERLDWLTWEVGDLAGREARIVIVDDASEGWGHINVDQIVMGDRRRAEVVRVDRLYDETYRPQIHFTARCNWLNDPNGLVYYRGEYHLFFQHNPLAIGWGNMTWGHAVSRDLVHWTQLANALEPDALGTVFSGSAVVDRGDTAGFAVGAERPIIAIYTAAGGTSPESQGKPFTQCIAYSTDRGRTFTRYAGNPVVPHIAAENRDPKVVWHEQTHRWVMALYLAEDRFALLTSPDLKRWSLLHEVRVPGSGECPDFFPIRVTGRTAELRWVLTAANGHYLVGRFDGHRFVPDEGPLVSDYGPNFYAVQTYSGLPASDPRRIQIAWMNGGSYPQMPFNQQMSFPCELTLRACPEGLRLFRMPVREIRSLRAGTREWSNRTLRPGEDLLAGTEGELFDVEAVIEPRGAAEVGFDVRGQRVRWVAADETLQALGRTAPLPLEKGRLRLRMLVDRTSIEVFGGDGRVSLTGCFLPPQSDRQVGLTCHGADARVVSLRVHRLRSAWPAARADDGEGAAGP